MPQYDGSIRINTEISTKNAQIQLAALENRMGKMADKIASLRAKMDSLKDAKIPTQEYQNLQKELDKATKELEKMVAQDSKLADIDEKIKSLTQSSTELASKMNSVEFAKDVSKEYENINSTIEQTKQLLDSWIERQNELESSGKTNTIEYQNAAKQVAALTDKLNTAEASMKQLVDSGKAFSIDTENVEYQKIAEKYESVNQKLEAQESLYDQIIEKQANSADKVDSLKYQINQLVEEGKAFTLGSDTEEFAKLSQQLQYAENDLAVLNQRHDLLLSKQEKNAAGYKNLSDTAKKSLDKVDAAVKKTSAGSFSQLGKTVQDTLSKLGLTVTKVSYGMKEMGERAKLSFSKINKSAKKSIGALGTIALRFKGLALSLLIFNQIRKAFDRVTSAVNDGFSNLYTDNEKFKKSVDELKASVLTLKNAFAAAFRPLVDIVIPYIRMASDYMIELLDKAGQFMAAVTGQKTYTKVIRQTADAFKEAKKAAEGYLNPLDEINKFSPKDEEGEIKMGVMFEEAPVSAQFKDMAEKLKDTMSKAFTPIREAWEREGQFVIDSWKYGLGEIRNLFGSIGADFAKVWQQEKTVKIFENILHIIGDIGLTAGNLAHNFREAWEENETGLHTLENIRDIIGAITENIRHAADATVEWSKDLDFSPLLTKVQEWTESLVPVFDTLSGIVTDFYEKVLLPLGTWTIEKGLPELLQVLIDFNNRVDWESLRANLAEFWDHLEPFAETVGEGLIIFIGRLSEALAKFINSLAFSEFLTMVENWMDKVNPEDVADGLQKIATAILILKGASIALPAISTGFSALSTAATVLKGALTVLTPVITTLKGALSLLASPIGIAAVAVAALAAGFIYLYNHCESFKNSIDTLYNDHIKPFFDSVVEGVGKLKEKFMEFWDGNVKPMLEEWGKKVTALWEEHIKPAFDKITDAVGRVFDSLKELWEEVIEPLAEWIIDNVLPVLLPIIDEIFSFSMDMIGSLMDDIGDLADIIADCVELVVDLLEGDWSGAWEKAGDIVGKIWDNIKRNTERAVGQIKEWINDLLSLFGKAESGSNLESQGKSYSNMARSMSAMRSVASPYSTNPAFATLAAAPIPKLATGAVIPPNKEFLAVLGDQKSGTNIEAPLDTIKQAQKESILEVLSELGLTGGLSSSSQTVIAKLYLDGKEITDAVIKNGIVRQMATGRNPFELGTT